MQLRKDNGLIKTGVTTAMSGLTLIMTVGRFITPASVASLKYTHRPDRLACPTSTASRGRSVWYTPFVQGPKNSCE